jgi:hypothetical protein
MMGGRVKWHEVFSRDYGQALKTRIPYTPSRQLGLFGLFTSIGV